jgi:hypothetical protein
MMTLQGFALVARDASVYIKIIAAIVGLLAAFFWVKSVSSADLNLSIFLPTTTGGLQ